jgi:hypothetical protein
MIRPAWLPSIVNVGGEWEHIFKMLYGIFKADFIQMGRTFEGRQIRWDDRKFDGMYDEGFWHLITRQDEETGERIPDFRRAERLPWCGPTISNSGDPVVKVWDYREGNGEIRTYLWLEFWDYVVILKKRMHRIGEIAFLVTAYHLDGTSRLRNLEQRYKHRET